MPCQPGAIRYPETDAMGLGGLGERSEHLDPTPNPTPRDIECPSKLIGSLVADQEVDAVGGDDLEGIRKRGDAECLEVEVQPYKQRIGWHCC